MWDRGWSASHRLHGTRTIDNQRSDAAVEKVSERKIAGWVMNARQEAVLGKNARPLALAHRRPAYCFVRTVVENPIYQSDQGLMAQYRIVVNKSCKDDSYNNTLMERFNRTLTTECLEQAS